MSAGSGGIRFAGRATDRALPMTRRVSGSCLSSGSFWPLTTRSRPSASRAAENGSLVRSTPVWRLATIALVQTLFVDGPRIRDWRSVARGSRLRHRTVRLWDHSRRAALLGPVAAPRRTWPRQKQRTGCRDRQRVARGRTIGCGDAVGQRAAEVVCRGATRLGYGTHCDAAPVVVNEATSAERASSRQWSGWTL